MREMVGESLAAAIAENAFIVAVTPDGDAIAASVWIDRLGT
nr:hypothetical protein [Micromonospora sp. DSM 115978]